MSRIGKKIIDIPEKTEVTVVDNTVTVKGPLGAISRFFKPDISIKIENKQVTLEPTKKTIESNALWGTYSSHISNMIEGVNKGFEKKLIVEGIGFKSDVKGTDLNLSLGFSHLVKLAIPKDLKVTAEKNVVTVSGVNKESVGEFSAKLRAFKKPEPYKGKGVHYSNEVVRRKQGKKSV